MKVNINAKNIGQVINTDTAHVVGTQVQHGQQAGPAQPEPVSSTPPRQDELTPTTTPQPVPQVKRERIFVCYSHQDRPWLQRLQTMMAPLLRDRTLNLWWDGEIKPAEKWEEQIDTALASARAALLLVSPNFLAS